MHLDTWYEQIPLVPKTEGAAKLVATFLEQPCDWPSTHEDNLVAELRFIHLTGSEHLAEAAVRNRERRTVIIQPAWA